MKNQKKHSGRCAAVCTLLFVLLSAAIFCRVPASAEELTNDLIREKEASVAAVKEERQQIQNSISDIKKVKESLEASKSDLTSYVQEMDANLNQLQANIDSLNQQIEDKETQIGETMQELEEATARQQEQYAVMKKRVRFIYEKGDTVYLELLMKAGSFGDFLNKSAYIQKLSEYDQRVLTEYTQQAQLVALTKQQLEEEQAALDDAKAAVEAEQASVEELISEKEVQISALSADISTQEASLAEYQASLNQRDSEIAALEKAIQEEKNRLASENQIHYGGGGFVWPAPSYTYISSEFGYRIHPIYGTNIFHSGLDMAAPSGSPILAAADGQVVAASYESSMGNYVMIDHGDGLYTIYMHASALYCSKGQSVTAGTKIAAVGSTGNSTGPHLHFSVRLNGSYVSPWNYL